ncbi:MAG: aminodeoxychorismate synthase component I [Myxococcota bacterium]
MSVSPTHGHSQRVMRLDEVLTQSGTVLLEGDWRRDGAALLFEQPLHTVEAYRPEDVPSVLETVDAATREGHFAAGALAYEAAAGWLGSRRALPADQRLAWFGIYQAPRLLSDATVETRASYMDAEFLSEQEFSSQVERVRALIGLGDVYQVNLTGRLGGQVASALGLYGRIREQKAPFRGWVQFGDESLVSASPELFFRREGKWVETRPMKGTAARRPSVSGDLSAAAALAASEKDRAENLMIVDLLRNDLGRLARPGSVVVSKLFDVETHHTAHQMTSTIRADIPEDVQWQTLFEALFPCGSITGAPKLRAMQRIEELEPEFRGFYCGAVGFAGPKQTGCFSVAIRTGTVRPNGTARFGVGAGIVWDSDPAAEYEECRTKSRFLTVEKPVGVFETMLCERGEIALLERHWARLSSSAAFLGIALARQAFDRVIADAAQRSAAHVLRVELQADGALAATTRPIPRASNGWRLAVTDVVADRDDFRFFHKTTDRTAYAAAEAQARAAECDEGLLVNDRGEVTEGSRTSVWIERDGLLITPPVDAGLLPGVHRAYVLDTVPNAREAPLTVSDLLNADRVFCGNAVRGLIPVRSVVVL